MKSSFLCEPMIREIELYKSIFDCTVDLVTYYSHCKKLSQMPYVLLCCFKIGALSNIT